MPAAGRHISSCRDIDTATIDSSVSSINIHPLRWLIRLSFSPTLPSALHYYLPALLLRVGANSWPLQGSELTSFLLVVLTGFDTVSFHSVGFEVYFDAVSAQDFTRALRPWLHPSCQ